EAHGVKPVYVPEMSRELSPKDIISLWKVYRLIVHEKPDIIHTHTAKAGTIGRISGMLYRWLNWKNVKIVHTFHGHFFHSYYGALKTRAFLLVEKFLARFATDKIVVISAQQFEEIHQRFGVGRSEQYEIIQLGIDLEPFQNSPEKRMLMRREVGAGDDEILIGFVGRLTEIKNVTLFLRVAEIYKNQKDENTPKLKFLIIGDGNLRATLEREADACGLNETIRFLGSRSDADVFYSGLDVIALTSLNEGTPLSLIEAMANGKPFISTAVGGVVDLLGAEQIRGEGFAVCERGVKIACNSAVDFYKGLIYLVKNETLQKSLASSGKKFIETEYDLKRLIKDEKNLYRELTKK
ncbi:MAG TPA: glycosyltransferase, partial [Pyrinomonadaceae bacterium]